MLHCEPVLMMKGHNEVAIRFTVSKHAESGLIEFIVSAVYAPGNGV